MMLEPTVVGNSEKPAPYHSPAERNLRRLRYLIDLFESGLRYALHPDSQAPSLRAERIALGIDLPELDAVPLWSACRGEGMVSIPFIEFIANEIDKAIEGFVENMKSGDPAGAEELRARGGALRLLLEKAGLRVKGAPVLPRLGDVFLSQDTLGEVCGSRGVLQRIVRQCEEPLITKMAV